MSANEVIACLGARGSFNARKLSYELPAEVFDLFSLFPNRFLSLLAGASGLAQDALINGKWIDDPSAVRAYRAMMPEERLEINALIGFMVHESTHKADLLISPFGLQYAGVLLREYEVLQAYLPRVLDRKEHLSAIRILAKLTEPAAGILTEPELRALWDELRLVVRKEIAWGDLGDLRPVLSSVEVGWDGLESVTGDHFGTGLVIEQVKVLGSFYSFRSLGARNWYIRPATIFETKAVAGTLLYLLSIAPEIADVRLYFHRVYVVNRDRLSRDYFIILDQIAAMHGYADLADVLAGTDAARIRHVLIVAQSLCWFALQAPPQMRDDKKATGVAGNAVLRLYCGLRNLMACLQDPKSKGLTSMAQLLMVLEQQPLFRTLEQAPIADALSASRGFLAATPERIAAIWNPDVRDHFKRVFGIMEPHFAARAPSYNSRIGQPESGNGRVHVTSNAEMEVYYNDHQAEGAYADWLAMRGALFFSTAVPTDAFIARLDAHFEAHLAWAPTCEHCGEMHTYWVSRFKTDHDVRCHATGKPTTISMGDVVRFERPD